MKTPLATLLEILDLERLDLYLFRGQNETGGSGRLFGGQVAAQSLVAAGRTVEDRAPHSLHAYFLRAGDPEIPVIYTVDPIRNGASFTTRRVVAMQEGQAIFNMSVSFHRVEDGHEHQEPMPDAPDPESLPTWKERFAGLESQIPPEMRSWMMRERAIDLRSDRPQSVIDPAPERVPSLAWMRANGSLPDDPFIHQCVLTYASDMSLLDNAVRPHGRGFPDRNLMVASLDHAVWFHRNDFRADEWILYAQDSPAAAGARGFARGTLYRRDGTLIASVAQEGLMRRITRPRDLAAGEPGASSGS